MLKNNAAPLKDLLLQYLRAEGLETPLLEYRLISSWPDVVGPAISRYTGSITIRNSTLNVQIKSAPLRQNLQMMRAELIRKLNDKVGATVIHDIHFQ